MWPMRNVITRLRLKKKRGAFTKIVIYFFFIYMKQHFIQPVSGSENSNIILG